MISNARFLFSVSLSVILVPSVTLATISVKTFLRLSLYSGCSCVLQIFVTMCLQFFLKIPSLWPTCAKPKLSPFHQDWHFFVLFLFFSIIIYFPNFPGHMVCNSFWLILSHSYLQSLYLCQDTVAYPMPLFCLILDD